jgi:tetratricopeptide (TPR) repeat protein
MRLNLMGCLSAAILLSPALAAAQSTPNLPAAMRTVVKTPEAIGLDGREFFPVPPSPAAKAVLDANLAATTDDFIKAPDEALNILWLGRRLGYLARFQDAIVVFSRGAEKFPQDARFLRHRGHRYVSTRQFDKAIADFQRAAALMADRPDEEEAVGSASSTRSGTLKFNIYYHMGLAYYVKGDFEHALAAYEECMKYRSDDESLVAISDWTYMALRRLGRDAEAKKLLAAIVPGMPIKDNTSYYQRLLMYKGLVKPEQILAANETDPLQIVTQGYGVGNFYLVNGDTAKATEIFRRVVAGSEWGAFGFIAAEADLARMK